MRNMEMDYGPLDHAEDWRRKFDDLNHQPVLIPTEPHRHCLFILWQYG